MNRAPADMAMPHQLAAAGTRNADFFWIHGARIHQLFGGFRVGKRAPSKPDKRCLSPIDDSSPDKREKLAQP